ncbi:MAG: response regulator transcription factor [Proteobacteria bacterium]|nr:response regulator transcription factor [Pseudomonadota bacterium]MBU1390031.1 response regulator transcription factor [Pseudomonadota bacterium]MBU1545018.1 response regulator transcription factor [Pseudomonadota bacterium]MBU2480378.1 response regulator transcription factor [Pseudomonadota bacterium]
METFNGMIADDHPIVRKAFQKIFRNTPHINFVGEAENGEQLLNLLQHQSVDFVVIDLVMPGTDGFEIISKIHALFPEIKIIAFSGFLNSINQQKAIQMGACASICKSESKEEILNAFEKIFDNQYYHSNVTETYYLKPLKRVEANPLSSREREIINMISQGNTSKEISDIMNISQWTVDKHRSNIKRKLGLKNLAAIIRYAIDTGEV